MESSIKDVRKDGEEDDSHADNCRRRRGVMGFEDVCKLVNLLITVFQYVLQTSFMYIEDTSLEASHFSKAPCILRLLIRLFVPSHPWPAVSSQAEHFRYQRPFRHGSPQEVLDQLKQIDGWRCNWPKGPSIKYAMLEGGGVRGVTVCDRGMGVKSMWRHAYTNFYHTYETWNLKWCLTFCCKICIVTEGGTDKNQPGQNPQEKTLPRTIEIEFVQGTLVRDFCTRPTKNRGGPRCVTYFRGVPGCVTKCDRGRGVKIGQK